MLPGFRCTGHAPRRGGLAGAWHCR